MTVSVQTSSVTYVGNGATTVFSFTFPATDRQYVRADLLVRATGQKLALGLDVDFSVDLVAGEVTYPLSGSPMESTHALYIRRDEPFTQDTSYSTQGNFSPETLEDALDYLTMLVQQIRNSTGQTGGVNIPSYSIIGLPSAIAGAPSLIYVFNASGGGIPCFSDGTNWRRVDTREIVS